MTQPTQKSNFDKFAAEQLNLATNELIANANPEQLDAALRVAITLNNTDLIATILSHPNAAKITAQNLTAAIKAAQEQQ
jgi:hypothetical protein